MASQKHYTSQFGDTTFTKVFVGGLAWETPTEELQKYFEQFGEILEAVIITDRNSGNSKGYGFVTFREPESARMACVNPNPVIDGRRANCNIAAFGRSTSTSPQSGKNQGGSTYQGGPSQGGSNYSGVPTPLPPPPSLLYQPYGYSSPYTPDYGYHQSQYYNQMYGTTSSSPMATTPYFYGYSQYVSPRATFSAEAAARMAGASYIYYPTQMERGSSAYTPPLQTSTRPQYYSFLSSSSTDSQSQQRASKETEAEATTKENQDN